MLRTNIKNNNNWAIKPFCLGWKHLRYIIILRWIDDDKFFFWFVRYHEAKCVTHILSVKTNYTRNVIITRNLAIQCECIAHTHPHIHSSTKCCTSCWHKWHIYVFMALSTSIHSNNKENIIIKFLTQSIVLWIEMIRIFSKYLNCIKHTHSHTTIKWKSFLLIQSQLIYWHAQLMIALIEKYVGMGLSTTNFKSPVWSMCTV